MSTIKNVILMKYFHVDLLTDKDLLVWVNSLPDSLLWQIESILQCDIPLGCTFVNNVTWRHVFKLNESILDKDVETIIGLLRLNGYKDVRIDGRRYDNLQWKNYCKLRTKID